MFEIGAKLDSDIFDTKKESKIKAKSISNQILPENQHQLVFRFEKRKGKPVTIIGEFYLSNDDKKSILKLLKKKLSCGGTIKDQWLEFQGDFKDKIKTILQHDGWKFK
jgi:translation initiation factor 1